MVAPLTVAAMVLSFAGPATASGGGSGNGAPAAVRKACLKQVDKRAANTQRIATKAAKSKWVTDERAEELSAALASDLAAIAEYRSAIQRAPWGEELLEACRLGFGGTRSIVAVDTRKLGVMIRAGKAESVFADLVLRLEEIAGARSGDEVADVAAMIAALTDALTQLGADAAALVDAALAISPSGWDDGTAQVALAELKDAAAGLAPLLAEIRSGIAALMAMASGDAG